MKNIHISRNFFIALLVFALAMLILGLFVGCSPVPDNEITKPEGKIYYKGSSPGTYEDQISKFEYNGHQYIRFGEYRSQTIVHDPDCKCHKNNNNNNTLFDW